MAKQRDIRALREAVVTAEFTPAMRDLDGVVELLGDDDAETAKGAERAILRAGGEVAAVASRVLARLDHAALPALYTRALRVVGGLAPTDPSSAARVIAALSHEDARVRRAAAHALGRLGESEAKGAIAAAVLAAWDEAPELPLARVLAEAMGKLGLGEARGRLESAFAPGGDAELARIARKSLAMLERDGTRHEASGIDGEREGGFDVDVAFFCRPGLERLLIEEIEERCPGARALRAGRPGEVTAVFRGALAPLASIRTALGFAFALRGERFETEGDVETACVRVLTSPLARRILEAWTSGTVRYRLEWEGRGHRRGATWRLVEALRASQPAWVNDPRESTWEVSLDVDAAHGEVRARLAPRRLADSRFDYRVRDVPAASHPTVAAALVRASRPRDADVVWDPFVGSGSELIERALAGPCARLVGSDVDPAALDAARANVAAANLGGRAPDIRLEVADATTYAPKGVSSIITNPPMGRRVARDGSLAALVDAFTDHAARVLVPGGRLVWLSPLGGRTAERAEKNLLRVSLRQVVDMGGFQAELQVWNKPGG
jgi:precorrin-6B methylase 2